jgi:hypothetical protein
VGRAGVLEAEVIETEVNDSVSETVLVMEDFIVGFRV